LDLALKPPLFLQCYSLALFRSAWFSALTKSYSLTIFGLCFGWCELQICMAFSVCSEINYTFIPILLPANFVENTRHSGAMPVFFALLANKII